MRTPGTKPFSFLKRKKKSTGFPKRKKVDFACETDSVSPKGGPSSNLGFCAAFSFGERKAKLPKESKTTLRSNNSLGLVRPPSKSSAFAWPEKQWLFLVLSKKGLT